VGGATISYDDGLGPPRFVLADGGGDYLFWVTDPWSGEVTPSMAGFKFVPVHTDYIDVATNQTGQNYTATISVIAKNVMVAGLPPPVIMAFPTPGIPSAAP
jgi:hypothetical protein